MKSGLLCQVYNSLLAAHLLATVERHPVKMPPVPIAEAVWKDTLGWPLSRAYLRPVDVKLLDAHSRYQARPSAIKTRILLTGG